MESKIEKMNRMRKIILICFLIGWGTLCLWILKPTIISLKFVWRDASSQIRFLQPWLKGLWILGVIILSIYILVYAAYKIKIKKDPFVDTAVNDERVKLNWLRAFRFAFYTLIAITIFWKWYETSHVPDVLHKKILMVHGPWLIWCGSIFALVISFLYYNREAKGQ